MSSSNGLPFEDSSAAISIHPHDDEDDYLKSDMENVPLIAPRSPIHGSSRRPLTHAVSNATLIHEGQDSMKSNLHEAKRIVELAVPLIVISISSFLCTMISIIAVGHVGTFELSVVVLAASLFNVTGLSILLGSLGALETLCSQAFGAKNYPAVGIALQRSLLFTATLGVIISLVWSKAEQILHLLGQEPALAAAAASFLHHSIPALFFVGLGECFKRYLTSQSVVAPATMASIIAMVAAPIFNYLLVIKYQLGLFGAAMAGNLSQLTPFIAILVWTYKREQKLKLTNSPEQTWHGWSKQAFSEWGVYIKLAGPSAAMVCLEWSTFEACVLLSGLLPNPEQDVSVMGLLLNYSGLVYMIPQGLGTSTAIRVGNALGSGLAHAAKRSAYVAMCINIIIQSSLALITIATRDIAGYIVTDDESIAVAASKIFPIVAWCLMGDGINSVVGGMLRGAGRQEIGAIFNLIAYWIVGLPLAATLAFKAKFGVLGLWIGLATCATINGVAMSIVLMRMNWKKEAQRAIAAAGQSNSIELAGDAKGFYKEHDSGLPKDQIEEAIAIVGSAEGLHGHYHHRTHHHHHHRAGDDQINL